MTSLISNYLVQVVLGVLPNGRAIAVKKLDPLLPGLQDKQYENEVYHLMKLKHPKIMLSVGYCYEIKNECVEHNGRYIFAERHERLLCLEYLNHGGLDRYISGMCNFSPFEITFMCLIIAPRLLL
ncbi:hypothetical protein BAE44_0014935 [Dichanthelium oligosanthes]|uniref:Protein kinase domain-containing protein n=1 Tax=Dichanthelium oligosanthes TaxID=888268 RepID=A0A1E5VFY9_9POAL|nr:hypothetical protein BAE44_0014935 [Dichanthelium oligosanthes]